MATQHFNATRLKLTDLSFVNALKNQRRSFWHVHPTKHYDQDIKIGAAIAHEFLNYLISRINAPDYNGIERHLLGDMVLSMGQANDADRGIKVGFCYELINQIEPMLVHRLA